MMTSPSCSFLNSPAFFPRLLQARVEFDESTEALFGPNGILGPGGGGALRLVPPRQKADLGLETLKSLVARINGVFLWFKMAKDW